MRPSQTISLILIVVLAWASLFVTVLNQSSRTNQLLKNDHKLLSQDTTILSTEKKTQTDLKNRIADLQSHVDCLFNLATQGNNAFISNASTCTVATGSATTGGPKANVTPSNNPGSTPRAAAPVQPSPPPAAAKPGLFKKITNFLGL